MTYKCEDQDPILPISITHNSEQMWSGSNLEQSYNYLVYHFETEEHLYRARAYLDEIDTVSVYGPLKKDELPDWGSFLQEIEIDRRIIAYLRKRYAKITRLAPTGYVIVE